MEIAIVGAGRVGLVVGACLSQVGHSITFIDVDRDKINILNQGKSYFFEPGLDHLLAQNKSRLHFTTNFDFIAKAEAIFVTVGTPLNTNTEEADLTYLMSAIGNIVRKIREDVVIIIKSTVPVGTSKKIKNYISQQTSKNFYIINNPEFLREGDAIKCFKEPDQIVIGVEDECAKIFMRNLYAPFIKSKVQFNEMSHASAEITKYALNSFLATKISFINDIANFCDFVGANIEEVANALKSDQRIGKDYFSPGPGYGGSCLIKDTKVFLKTGKKLGIDFDIIQAANRVNDRQRDIIFKKLESHFPSLVNRVISLWGGAFKAHTDDVQMSAAIPFVRNIIEKGGYVQFYDPMANQSFFNIFKECQDRFFLKRDMYECLEGSDALVIMTEWPEFFNPDWIKVKQLIKSPLVFDARNIYSTQKMSSLGFSYIAIGKSTLCR